MKHKSLHAYLDELFSDRSNVSDGEIRAAKNEYWRTYNTELKKRRRQLHREFSVRFSLGEFEQIKPYLCSKPMSHFIRNAVLRHVKQNPVLDNRYDSSIIEQQLFLISQLLEEMTLLDHVPEYLITDLQSTITIIKGTIASHDH